MKRLFKFKLLTQMQLEKFETDATTFGELVAAIEADPVMSEKISFGTKKITEGGTDYEVGIKLIEKNLLTEYGSVPEALLPAGEAIFFVTPTRTKAGADMEIYSTEELMEMGYNELRSLGSRLNSDYGAMLSLHGKREDILHRIDKFYDEIIPEPEAEAEPDMDTIKEHLYVAIALIQDVIDNLQESNFIDGITHEELHTKALQLQQQLSKEV